MQQLQDRMERRRVYRGPPVLEVRPKCPRPECGSTKRHTDGGYRSGAYYVRYVTCECGHKYKTMEAVES